MFKYSYNVTLIQYFGKIIKIVWYHNKKIIKKERLETWHGILKE